MHSGIWLTRNEIFVLEEIVRNVFVVVFLLLFFFYYYSILFTLWPEHVVGMFVEKQKKKKILILIFFFFFFWLCLFISVTVVWY